MFNQKVNGFVADNPDYLNIAYGAPLLKPQEIHNCGTTILKYAKPKYCNSLPLQSWCSPNVAVESFAMRPIVNSKEYFESLTKYFTSIVIGDSVQLKNTNIPKEQFTLFEDYGKEPASSLLQLLQTEVTEHLSNLMKESTTNVSIFSEYDPLCEGLVITDIDIATFTSTSNPNHYFHRAIFSVFNTTRYNTVSLKAEIYQDITPMINDWNKAISLVENSENVQNFKTHSLVYISYLSVINNLSCVLGQEDDCEFKGFNLGGAFSQLLNDNLLKSPSDINWIQPNAFGQNTYTVDGNYDENGNISIVDDGPSDFSSLLNQFKV
jgi:hypothetical protein